MKMRIPPRMLPKMKMMSRCTSSLFSFPFWHLMTKGEWNCHLCTHLGMCRLCIELMSFPFRFELPRSCVRTMWCENICNVCYSVLSCRTWVYSKEFLLVCDIFELWPICFMFFCVLVQKGRILRDTGRILRRSWPESLDLYPESPGSAVEHLFSWVNNMSYASHLSLHSPVHPTVKHIRAFVILLICMPIIDISSQNWNSKFMAYI